MQHQRNTNYYAILELSADATEVILNAPGMNRCRSGIPTASLHSSTLHKKAGSSHAVDQSGLSNTQRSHGACPLR